MSISSVVTKISIGSIAAKSAGVIGLGAVAYDSHKFASIKSDEYRKSCTSESLLNSFASTGVSSSSSTIMSGVKDFLFNRKVNNQGLSPIKGVINKIVGYVGGIGSAFATNIIPLTLSAAAVMTKGLPSKLAAGVLVAHTAIHGVKELSTKREI